MKNVNSNNIESFPKTNLKKKTNVGNIKEHALHENKSIKKTITNYGVSCNNLGLVSETDVYAHNEGGIDESVLKDANKTHEAGFLFNKKREKKKKEKT